MFSFTHVPQSSYPYGPARPRPYSHSTAYPYAYTRALAEEQAARAAAARRAAAEQEARARFARSHWNDDDDDDDDEGYGRHDYVYGLSPRERAYAEAKRREAINSRRAQMVAAEEQRKQAMMEERTRRERELRMAQNTAEAQQSSEQTARTPSPARGPSNPTPQRTPPHSKPETTSSATPTPEAIDAATKIQTFYRTCKALDTISQLESKFEDLKRAFVLPETIDFLSDDGSIVTLRLDGNHLPVPTTITQTQPNISSRAARLAFTHTNIPIRTYDETLNRILTQLDAVQSWGDRKVRERRKNVVCAVEGEARRVEGIWGGVWEGRFGNADAEAEKDVMEENEVSALVDEGDAPPAIRDADTGEVEMENSSAEDNENETHLEPDAPEMSLAAHVIDEETISHAEDNVEMTESLLPLSDNHTADQEDAQMALDAPPLHTVSIELDSATPITAAPESQSLRPSSPQMLAEHASVAPTVVEIQSTLGLNSTSPHRQTPVIDTSENVRAESVIATPEVVTPNSEHGSEGSDTESMGSDDDGDDDLDYVSFHSAASDAEEGAEEDDEWDADADAVSDDESIDFVVL